MVNILITLVVIGIALGITFLGGAIALVAATFVGLLILIRVDPGHHGHAHR